MANNMLAITDAINAGATWSAKHLVVSGVHTWLTLSAGVWGLTTSSGGFKMQARVFELLQGGTVEPSGEYIQTDAGRFQLVSIAGYATFAEP